MLVLGTDDARPAPQEIPQPSATQWNAARPLALSVFHRFQRKPVGRDVMRDADRRHGSCTGG